MPPSTVKLSLSTACLFPLPLRSVCRLAAETGYQGIEWVMGPGAWLREAHALKRLAVSYDLSIYSVHQALWRPRPAGWGPERMLAAAHMALELECSRVVIHGPWVSDWSEPEAQDWLQDLEACQKRLLGTPVRLALENPGIYSALDGQNVLGSFPVLLSFARGHDLDLTLDTCHVGTRHAPLLEAYAAIRERLVNIHVSDLREGHHQGSRLLRSVYAHHQLPGEGHLPLVDLLRCLTLDDYDGILTVEVSPFALRAWSSGKRRERLTRTRGYLVRNLTGPHAQTRRAPSPVAAGRSLGG
ncbi:MAG: sugar phosphate isomerase/epimerase [Anaerolineae bacterium]|nr:sugar phosphate isomerase/epimerase [Anaerolineae bacterium]